VNATSTADVVNELLVLCCSALVLCCAVQSSALLFALCFPDAALFFAVCLDDMHDANIRGMEET